MRLGLGLGLGGLSRAPCPLELPPLACAEESGWTRVRCCPPEIAPPAEEIAPPAEEIAPPPLREPPLTPATAPGEGGADLGGAVYTAAAPEAAARGRCSARPP